MAKHHAAFNDYEVKDGKLIITHYPLSSPSFEEVHDMSDIEKAKELAIENTDHTGYA